MAERVPARLTRAQGRRFGVTVGVAFLVFMAIAWWRGHPNVTTVLGTLGGLLVLAGLAIPTYLGPVERAWMALAHAISKVTTPIVMGVMYLAVLTPAGILRRRFGGNPLEHRPGAEGYWQERPANRRRSASLQRQF